eukprot:2702326-Pleurochrysis_carterae.AAC.4
MYAALLLTKCRALQAADENHLGDVTRPEWAFRWRRVPRARPCGPPSSAAPALTPKRMRPQGRAAAAVCSVRARDPVRQCSRPRQCSPKARECACVGRRTRVDSRLNACVCMGVDVLHKTNSQEADAGHSKDVSEQRMRVVCRVVARIARVGNHVNQLRYRNPSTPYASFGPGPFRSIRYGEEMIGKRSTLRQQRSCRAP